jgi:hypothetical protein
VFDENGSEEPRRAESTPMLWVFVGVFSGKMCYWPSKDSKDACEPLSRQWHQCKHCKETREIAGNPASEDLPGGPDEHQCLIEAIPHLRTGVERRHCVLHYHW